MVVVNIKYVIRDIFFCNPATHLSGTSGVSEEISGVSEGKELLEKTWAREKKKDKRREKKEGKGKHNTPAVSR